MILIPIALVVLAFVAYDLSRPKHKIEAEHSVGAVARGVVFALGRAEGRKLIRHPVLLAGVALTLFAIWVVGVGNLASWSRDDHAVALFLFPYAGLTIVAVTLGVLRGRRDATEELYASLPATLESRTGGHLVASMWATAIGILLTILLVAYGYIRGGFGTPDIGELLTGPILIACAGAVGVTAARLVPSAAVGVVAVVLMGVLQGSTAHFSGSTTTRTAWFAPWVEDGDMIGTGIWVRRPWSHLVYLVGLGLFAAVLGFLRHRVDRRTVGALGVSLAIIAAGGIVQSRPFSDAEYERMASFIEHGATSCEVRAGVEYCSFPDHEPLIERWAVTVDGVLSALPSTLTASPPRFVQRVSFSRLFELPPRLKMRLEPATPDEPPEVWQPDGAIHPGVGWCVGSCDLALAVQTAAWAVGLPLEPSSSRPNLVDPWAGPEVETYEASGEARAVLALWLGARATPSARGFFLTRLRQADPDPEPSHEVQGQPGRPFTLVGCEGITDPGTSFGTIEALYARALLGIDDAEVLRTVAAHWPRLSDPATPSSAIASLFGIEVSSAEAARTIFQSC